MYLLHTDAKKCKCSAVYYWMLIDGLSAVETLSVITLQLNSTLTNLNGHKRQAAYAQGCCSSKQHLELHFIQKVMTIHWETMSHESMSQCFPDELGEKSSRRVSWLWGEREQVRPKLKQRVRVRECGGIITLSYGSVPVRIHGKYMLG